VLGIPYAVDDGTITQYENSLGPVNPGDFFIALNPGDRVEIEDKEPEDGLADKVKLDN
jgi:hypothetical protein